MTFLPVSVACGADVLAFLRGDLTPTFAFIFLLSLFGAFSIGGVLFWHSFDILHVSGNCGILSHTSLLVLYVLEQLIQSKELVLLSSISFQDGKVGTERTAKSFGKFENYDMLKVSEISVILALITLTRLPYCSIDLHFS